MILKADTGATNHYFRLRDISILKNITKCSNNKSVQLPNSNSIDITHQGVLPISNKLSMKAKTAHIISKLINSSLLSLGQLCDDNC